MLHIFHNSIADLKKSNYHDALDYNQDHSAFVYTSKVEHQDWVFYPELVNNENIEHVGKELIDKYWRNSLPHNIAPFQLAIIVAVISLACSFPLPMPYTIIIFILTFILSLYLFKVVFSIIGGTLSQTMFLNTKFNILPVNEGLGKYSTIDDKVRSRKHDDFMFAPLMSKSEVLANSHFIEIRVYEETNEQLAK